MVAVYNMIRQIAPTRATVLIMGETGLARAWRRKRSIRTARAGTPP